MFKSRTDKQPRGVTVSADRHVYVAQWWENTISVFAADDGRLLRTLGEGRWPAAEHAGSGERQWISATDVALSADGGLLYIADYGNHRVAVWRSADGALLQSIGGGEGSGLGQLRNPWGLALSPGGAELFVVEYGNHRVSVFEPRTGRHLRSWGRVGSGPGRFRYPNHCALSHDGRVLFVADTSNHRVVACDAVSGGTLWCSGRRGSGDGELSYPHGLALSRCGCELFVTDYGNDRVMVLAVADGSARRSWAVAGGPEGVSLGPDNRLFVTSHRSNRLHKFS